jgi:hypothetical protein
MKWEGENALTMHDQGGLGKCKVGTPHSHEGLGLVGGTSRWCMIC